jgi:hypothetical protein
MISQITNLAISIVGVVEGEGGGEGEEFADIYLSLITLFGSIHS